MTTDTAAARDVTAWLARAAALQFASLALQAPSAELIAEMRGLAPTLPEDLARRAQEILQLPLEDWEPEFFSVLGPAGCPVSESSYERAAQASRGPLLARVAAYYDAFGFVPAAPRDVPDHLAIELAFLSYLAVKVAFAAFDASADKARVAEDAFNHFRDRHLGQWLPECLEAIRATRSPQYSLIADLAAAALPPSAAQPEAGASSRLQADEQSAGTS